MFKIVSSPSFNRTVKVKVPIDGGFREETLKATFRVIPTSEAARFDLDRREDASAFLARVVERLDDLADDAGNAIDYSDAVRDQVIDMPYVRAALARAYFEAVAGAKAGN